MKRWLGAVGVVALLVVAAALTYLAMRQRAYTGALRADSLQAALDSSRRVVAAAAGDRALWERRALQAGIERDALDRELGRTSAVRAGLEGEVRRLRARVEAPETVSVDSAGSREASWSFYEEPYQVEAKAVLPVPPARPTLELGIRLDTVSVEFRVSCGESVAGVAPATVSLRGPPWLAVRIGSVQQEPRVCSPAPISFTGPQLRVPKWVLIVTHLGVFVAGLAL